MIEIRNILCPIDFSDHSRRALDQALALAHRYEASITVLYVFAAVPGATFAPGTPGFDTIILTPEDREQLLAEMKRFVDAESAAAVPAQLMIRKGDIATEVLSEAKNLKADLLVLGTHGRSGFERFVMGSVTEKLLRKASCQVLTVPRHHPDAVPIVPGMFKRILCPVDFSRCSISALHYAMLLAQEADARLTVLHVATDELVTPDLYGTIVHDARETVADFRHRRRQEALELLKRAVPETVAAYCDVETLVTDGKPSREILRVAAEQQSDLIVTGIQGRGAVDMAFFGSTTNHVVREATCPVLTIRGS